MKRKILIIGPFPGPPKGISLSNKVVSEGLAVKGWKVAELNTEQSDKVNSEIGTFSFQKLAFLKTYLEIYKIFAADIVYITIGITFFGVIKYAPFIILSKFLNKKTVVHLHSDHLKTEYKSLAGLKRKIFKKLMTSFDSGIVLSESLRDNLTPFVVNDSIFEVYNFVEDKLMISEETILNKDYAEIRLFFLSNLLEEKGINILLNVIKKLNREGTILKIKIAGNKIQGNNIDLILEELENVEYLGVVSGKLKQDLLLWGNIFCLPTFFSMEGQPISILEAMSFNNLILTTNHAGISDICGDENAVFCIKKSEEDLYIKLKFIISNWSELQLKAVSNGIYGRSTFTESRFITAIEEVLLTTIGA
ncbi:glycosyltransferase family 4 protein [Flavobacterium taihuense]|uniref:Glycosyltransferase family 4 protein n=1 Tax=Flavobacterium taihuense TaxID=2857508 RepID=A0ABS6XQH3_9FLAO|nr:glycosyltransferase family 4 protein [Flavobacterium taihuense]MBW4358928.1 glycosyltransferase family 4 protein [Flavobacterium taihuense]